MKFMYTIVVILLIFSCQKKELVKTKTVKDYEVEISKIKKYAKENKHNQNIAFMIDYSLHSGKNRFFVVDLKMNKIIKKGLVCHGSCKGDNNNSYAKVFSNVNESHCSSLGMSMIGKRDYSSWGKNYKYWINGLESTNSKMKSRVVVLHAWKGVKDKEIFPSTLATSFGCPTVSIKFLDGLDVILKQQKKVLLYSFD